MQMMMGSTTWAVVMEMHCQQRETVDSWAEEHYLVQDHPVEGQWLVVEHLRQWVWESVRWMPKEKVQAVGSHMYKKGLTGGNWGKELPWRPCFCLVPREGKWILHLLRRWMVLTCFHSQRLHLERIEEVERENKVSLTSEFISQLL